MIIAAHQPLYLPWLGFFHKMEQADLFVLVDHVQYEAQNFQNRNRVKVNNGVQWLVVPIEHRGSVAPLCEKRIAAARASRHHWQRRSWRTLTLHYRRAPWFHRYAGALEEVYTRPWERLVDLNLHLIRLCMEWLEIDRPLVLSSQLKPLGHRTEMILSICRAVGAHGYLSGIGGSLAYLDTDRLRAEGIDVRWQQFQHPVYPQRYPALGFVRGLSALDLILNCGPGSGALLRAAGDDRKAAAPVCSEGGIPC
jgi:hypothetical protein